MFGFRKSACFLSGFKNFHSLSSLRASCRSRSLSMPRWPSPLVCYSTGRFMSGIGSSLFAPFSANRTAFQLTSRLALQNTRRAYGKFLVKRNPRKRGIRRRAQILVSVQIITTFVFHLYNFYFFV